MKGSTGCLVEEDSLIQRVTEDGIKEILDGGTVTAGMLPKLESCVAAIEAGVERVHILDGRIQHSVLLEVFTPEGIGTMITKEPVP